MADKKILTGIIKRLDRVIALLDNGIDTGELSESTRRRLVEMLHLSISDIYSIGKDDEAVNEVVTPAPTVDEPQEIETVSNPVEEELPVVAEQEYVSETENVSPQVTEQLKQNEQNYVSNQIQEMELGTRLDELIELETISSAEYAIPEAVEEQKAENPIIEEEPQQSIIQEVPELVNNIEEEKLAQEKAQLAELRNQLEEERKRLEEELLSWQRERLKREEEMKAAEQLLTTLEAETQKRKADAQVVNNNPVVVATPPPVVVQTPAAPPVVETPKVAPTPPPVINTNTNANANGSTAPKTTTIGDKLSEKRQSIQNSSSSEDLKRQGITPITDLTRSIGINDKFQFIKELFGGDSDKYTETIRTLNNFKDLDDALNYLESNFNWDKNNDAVKRMVLLVRRRYM